MTPRRQRGEGSVFQRRDGLWAGTVDAGYVDGKRRRRTVYGRTQREVVKKLAAERRAIETGTVVMRGTTVETWMAYWLEQIAAKRVKPSTLATYTAYTRTHIVPVLGPVRLDKLTPAHVRQLHDSVATATVHGETLSPTTVLHVHRVFATALAAAMRDGKVSRNVALLVDAPRRAVPHRRALSVPEAIAVLHAAQGDPVASRWMAALLLGARQGELLGLRWQYVDLDAGLADLAWSLQRIRYSHGCEQPCGRKRGASCPQRRVTVPAGMEHEQLDGNLCLIRPKTIGSRRVVPLPEPLRLALLERRATAARSPHGLVWARPDGRPLAPRDDWAGWKRLLTSAQVPGVTLHEARHTTVTLLMEAGVDPRIIAAIVGHSDVLTQRAYSHVDQRLAREALDLLGRRLALD